MSESPQITDDAAFTASESDDPTTKPLMVYKCQRCGKDHEMQFQVLLNAVDEWKWWAMCGNTNQPVLLANADDEMMKEIC